MAVHDLGISTSVNAALAAVTTAVANAGTLATATPFQLAPVAAAVSKEIAVVQAAISAFDQDMATTTFAGLVPGTAPPTMWPAFLAQVRDSQQIAVLINALGYLQRLSTNLSEATG